MIVALTGANGFLGTCMVDRLENKGGLLRVRSTAG